MASALHSITLRRLAIATVLVMGAGYDAAAEDVTTPSSDTIR